MKPLYKYQSGSTVDLAKLLGNPRDIVNSMRAKGDNTNVRIQNRTLTTPVSEEEIASNDKAALVRKRMLYLEALRRKKAIALSNSTNEFKNSAVADKSRVFPDDTDDYVNPVTMLGNMSDFIGKSWGNPATSNEDHINRALSILGPIAIGKFGKGMSNSKFINHALNPIGTISTPLIAGINSKNENNLLDDALDTKNLRLGEYLYGNLGDSSVNTKMQLAQQFNLPNYQESEHSDSLLMNTINNQLQNKKIGGNIKMKSIHQFLQEGGSIVDYLKSIGVDSSKTNRKKLANIAGNKDYNYSADDNIALLNYMKNQSQSDGVANTEAALKSMVDNQVNDVVPYGLGIQPQVAAVQQTNQPQTIPVSTRMSVSHPRTQHHRRHSAVVAGVRPASNIPFANPSYDNIGGLPLYTGNGHINTPPRRATENNPVPQQASNTVQNNNQSESTFYGGDIAALGSGALTAGVIAGSLGAFDGMGKKLIPNVNINKMTPAFIAQANNNYMRNADLMDLTEQLNKNVKRSPKKLQTMYNNLNKIEYDDELKSIVKANPNNLEYKKLLEQIQKRKASLKSAVKDEGSLLKEIPGMARRIFKNFR